MKHSQHYWPALKMAVFCLSLLPAIFLTLDSIHDNLGANPVETLHFSLGRWALRFLCLTLVLTPLRYMLNQRWPLRFRRMFGLFAFFYASLHLLVFLWLDIEFSWYYFRLEVADSPYLLLGLSTFALLLPLAITSTQSLQKRLGKHWRSLHKLIYPAAVLAVLHYLMLVKSDLSQPLLYAGILTFLLFFRLFQYTQKNKLRHISDKKKAVK
jgi:sulfoxide reductase heme-binding subunit YedZ